MLCFPSEIRAGVTLNQRNTFTAYPADDGWTVAVVLRGPASIDLTATADGVTHVLAATAAETAAWAPGLYAWQAQATDGAEVVDLGAGVVRVLAALGGVTGPHDATTHAERTLAAIEAIIEKRANLDQQKYKINGRELERMPIGDLLKLRSTYRAEVARERRARKGVSLFGQNVRVRI